MHRSAHTHFILLLAALVLAALLRFAWLDSVPPGINQDEAVHAFEAYCLRTEGTDHFGTPWPAFVRAYGRSDHHSAPFVYLLAGAQAFFGVSAWSTRFVPAAGGVANVFLVYLLVRRFYGQAAGLWAALFLAVSPWHVHLSRLAFEVSICPPLLTLGMVLLASGLRRDNQGVFDLSYGSVLCVALGGMVLGLTAWTYNAMRVLVPLLVILGTGLYASRIKLLLRTGCGRSVLAGFGVGLFVGLGPFLVAWARTPEKVWGRASTEFVLSRTSDLGEAVRSTAGIYAMHFSPAFLFLGGDPSPLQSVPGYGQWHYYGLVLVPLGMVRAVRRWPVERFGLFVLGWMLLGPVPPALTDLEAGHSLRSAGMLPAVQILCALGLDMILCVARRRSPKTYAGVVTAGAILIGANTAYFAYRLGWIYPTEAYRAFQAEWKPVIRDVEEKRGEYDVVVLSPEGTNQLGMLYLFWSGRTPAQYFANPREIREGQRWDLILRLENVYFVPAAGFLEQLPAGVTALVAACPGLAIPGREIRRYVYPGGAPAVVLYDVRR